MTTKQQLVDELTPGIVKQQGKPPQVVRQLLDNLTVTELNLMRDRQISSGVLVLNQPLTEQEIAAAETIGQGILNSQQELLKQQELRETQALEFQGERHAREALASQAKSRELETQDRQTFDASARQFGYSLHEANFKTVRDVLGPGFSLQDIQSNLSGMRLIAATAEEQETFRQELIEERKQYLKSLDIETLRRMAREEGRTAAQRYQTSEQQSYQARQLKEQTDQRPPLPKQNATGEALDTAYFRKLSIHNMELFKAFCRKHGSTAITNRINGLD